MATWSHPAPGTAKSKSGKSATVLLSRTSTGRQDFSNLKNNYSLSGKCSVISKQGLMLQRTTNNEQLTNSDRPQLRPYLAATPDDRDPRFVVLWDKLGLSPEPLRVNIAEFCWLQQFDGRRTLRDVQAEAD